MTMFTIGDFAKLAQVSTHRLRNYDKQGLLHPIQIDKKTGYRYYSAEQLGKLNRIVALRGLDMPLEEIKAALTAEVDVDQMKQMLLQRQSELEDEIATKTIQLQQVLYRLKQIEDESNQPLFEIIVKRLPAYPVASIRELVPSADEIPFHSRVLHPEIYYALEKLGVKPQSPSMNLYHHDAYTNTNIDFEACISVPFRALNHSTGSRVQFREIEEVPMAATLLYSENCDHVELAFMTLVQWAARNGYRAAGPTREVHYAPMIHSVKNQNGDTIAEIQMPIEKISSQP